MASLFDAPMFGRGGRQYDPILEPHLMPMEPWEEESLTSDILGTTLGTVGYIGGALDKPGRAVRAGLDMAVDFWQGEENDTPMSELLSWVPFSDTIGFTNNENMVTGRDVLENAGALAENVEGFRPFDNPRDALGDAIGIGFEILTDPFAPLALGKGAVTGAGRIAKGMGLFDGIAGGGGKLAGRAGRRVGQQTNDLFTTLLRQTPDSLKRAPGDVDVGMSGMIGRNITDIDRTLAEVRMKVTKPGMTPEDIQIAGAKVLGWGDLPRKADSGPWKLDELGDILRAHHGHAPITDDALRVLDTAQKAKIQEAGAHSISRATRLAGEGTQVRFETPGGDFFEHTAGMTGERLGGSISYKVPGFKRGVWDGGKVGRLISDTLDQGLDWARHTGPGRAVSAGFEWSSGNITSPIGQAIRKNLHARTKNTIGGPSIELAEHMVGRMRQINVDPILPEFVSKKRWEAMDDVEKTAMRHEFRGELVGQYMEGMIEDRGQVALDLMSVSDDIQGVMEILGDTAKHGNVETMNRKAARDALGVKIPEGAAEDMTYAHRKAQTVQGLDQNYYKSKIVDTQVDAVMKRNPALRAATRYTLNQITLDPHIKSLVRDMRQSVVEGEKWAAPLDEAGVSPLQKYVAQNYYITPDEQWRWRRDDKFFAEANKLSGGTLGKKKAMYQMPPRYKDPWDLKDTDAPPRDPMAEFDAPQEGFDISPEWKPGVDDTEDQMLDRLGDPGKPAPQQQPGTPEGYGGGAPDFGFDYSGQGRLLEKGTPQNPKRIQDLRITHNGLVDALSDQYTTAMRRNGSTEAQIHRAVSRLRREVHPQIDDILAEYGEFAGDFEGLAERLAQTTPSRYVFEGPTAFNVNRFDNLDPGLSMFPVDPLDKPEWMSPSDWETALQDHKGLQKWMIPHDLPEDDFLDLIERGWIDIPTEGAWDSGDEALLILDQFDGYLKNKTGISGFSGFHRAHPQELTVEETAAFGVMQRLVKEAGQVKKETLQNADELGKWAFNANDKYMDTPGWKGFYGDPVRDLVSYASEMDQATAGISAIQQTMARIATNVIPEGDEAGYVTLRKALEEITNGSNQVSLGAKSKGGELFNVDPRATKSLTDKIMKGSNDPAVKQLTQQGDGMLDDLYVPADFAHEATRAVQMIHPGEAGSEFLRAYDELLRRTKAGLTVPFPAFHTRNFATGLWMAFLGGARDPRKTGANAWIEPWMLAGDIFGDKGLTPRMKNIHEVFPEVKEIDNYNWEVMADKVGSSWSKMDEAQRGAFKDSKTIEMLRREMGGSELVTGTQMKHELATGTENALPSVRKLKKGETHTLTTEEEFTRMLPGSPGQSAQTYGGVLKRSNVNRQVRLEGDDPFDRFLGNVEGFGKTKGAINRAKELYKTPVDLGKGIGDFVESRNRGAPYIAYRLQGMSPEAAAAKAKALNVDYSKATNLERTFAKRMMPFYAFTRGMLPVVLQELVQHPGGPQSQMMRIGLGIRREEGGYLPPHMASGLAIPVGDPDEDGRRGYLMGMDLPHEDILELINLQPTLMGSVQATMMGLIGRGNPALTKPAELATGQHFYSGRDIRTLQGTVNKTLESTADIINYGLGDSVHIPAALQPFLDAQIPKPWANFAETAVAMSPMSRVFGTAKKGSSQIANLAQGVSEGNPKKWRDAMIEMFFDHAIGTRIQRTDLQAAQDTGIRDVLEDKLANVPFASTFEDIVIPKDDILKLSKEQLDLYRLKIQRRRRWQAEKKRRENAEAGRF